MFTLSSNKVSSARPVSLAEIGLAVLNPPYCLRVKMPDSSGLLKWVDHWMLLFAWNALIFNSITIALTTSVKLCKTCKWNYHKHFSAQIRRLSSQYPKKYLDDVVWYSSSIEERKCCVRWHIEEEKHSSLRMDIWSLTRKMVLSLVWGKGGGQRGEEKPTGCGRGCVNCDWGDHTIPCRPLLTHSS